MTAGPLTEAGRFVIAADHPGLPGHFPGHPVVPGVVLLDHAVEIVLQSHPRLRASGLPVVKFVRPVLPGHTVCVGHGAAEDGRVAFTCSVEGETVVRGTVAVSERP